MSKQLRFDLTDIAVEDLTGLTLTVEGSVPVFCDKTWEDTLLHQPEITLECCVDSNDECIYSIDAVARLNMNTRFECYEVDDFPTFTVWYENDREKVVSQAIIDKFVQLLSTGLDDDFSLNASYYRH